ncbi:hypothetical protein PEBR_43182 [Penicillium brasilianum]|uniref:RING-type domain-containing protein n=1 Tax=Penicillium brasilianum TaxID=104259 RepID=A0A1S9R8R6_PENBI|nr:hypothetical protein PEBR_43182 [Penicillium brasilianum]
MACAVLPKLSQIIRLEPENEPWCAGYAPSQGRRCHNRTNAAGRSQAMHLLGHGTKALRAGHSIEDILEDLAPLVLCKRFHQSQASDLASRWKKEVQSFLLSQAPTTSSRRQSVVSKSSKTRQKASNEILELERILAHLQNSHHNSAVPNSIPHNATVLSPNTDAGNPRRHANYQGLRASSSGQTEHTPRERGVLPPVSRQQSTSARSTQVVRSIGSISGHMEQPRRREVITQLRPTQEVSDSTTMEAARPRERPQASVRTSNVESGGTTPLHVHSRSPPTRAAQRRTEQAVVSVAHPHIPTRRTVEGDCGICLCALQEAADDTRDGGHDTDNEDELNRDAVERYEDLVWCKAQCGVNFHKACMDQWLKRAPSRTCPACRRSWRE